jgi:hypothetical protein
MAIHLRLVHPGGTVVLEEVDTVSLHHLPRSPAFDQLKPLVIEAFRKAGGDPDAAATQLDLFRNAGIEPHLRAESGRCRRGIPPCRSRFSTSPRWMGCCGRWSTPRSCSGFARRPSASSRTLAAGDSTSPSSSAGACAEPEQASILTGMLATSC